MQEGFEDTGFTGRGWYDNTSLTITAAEHMPSGSRSLEVKFNQGSSTPTFGNSMRIRFTPTETVYLSYWVKYSSNWVGSGVSYHPMSFSSSRTTASGSDPMTHSRLMSSTITRTAGSRS